MTIAFTGHRPNKLGFEYGYKGPTTAYVREKMEYYINLYKPKIIKNGGALGADFISSIIAIHLGIPLSIYVPCLHQDTKWSKEDKRLYKYILDHATHIEWVSKMPYFKGCMNRRNIAMIDSLIEPDDHVIGVYNGSSGGTADCLAYAESLHKNIDIINPLEKP